MLPFRPWSTYETTDNLPLASQNNGLNVTALIPARNEEAHIKKLVEDLLDSELFEHVIVVDDESTDNTLSNLKKITSEKLTVINGSTLPEGWVGKVWALHQGSINVTTQYVLLIDADIECDKPTVEAVFKKAQSEKLQLTSIMAFFKKESLWDTIMIPAFIYFFKSLYPFKLSNDFKCKSISAAAGGFILMETSALWKIGGFSALKNALIDDCTLSKLVKNSGGKTWIGLSKGIRTKRSYKTLSNFWAMIERTAFTQLNYSFSKLILCTLIICLMFFVPLIGLVMPSKVIIGIGLVSILIMTFTYYPVVKYYELNTLNLVLLPFTTLLFLLMTWSSAIKYMVGKRSMWKGRVYKR